MSRQVTVLFNGRGRPAHPDPARNGRCSAAGRLALILRGLGVKVYGLLLAGCSPNFNAPTLCSHTSDDLVLRNKTVPTVARVVPFLASWVLTSSRGHCAVAGYRRNARILRQRDHRTVGIFCEQIRTTTGV